MGKTVFVKMPIPFDKLNQNNVSISPEVIRKSLKGTKHIPVVRYDESESDGYETTVVGIVSDDLYFEPMCNSIMGGLTLFNEVDFISWEVEMSPCFEITMSARNDDDTTIIEEAKMININMINNKEVAV